MIAATVVAILLLFGAGSGFFGDLVTNYIEDPIKTTIVDEERRELALDELDSIQDAVDDLNEELAKEFKQFDKLVKNYDSTPADFDSFSISILSQNRQAIEAIWDRRSAMLKHIQDDEWKRIIARAKAEMEKDLD